jgi:hypothetical protein
MELLPTSSKKSLNNEASSRRFKRSSSMPLILTRLTKFPQMDFEVRAGDHRIWISSILSNLICSNSLLSGKWHIY